LRRAIDGEAQVVLDLSALQFIDSEGLRCLVKAAQELAETRRLGVIRPSSEVARLLSLTGIDEVLPFLD
jgi:anti-anti-sigma factor